MSLERLIEEIRARGEAELHETQARFTTEAAQVEAEGARRVQELGAEAERLGEIEANRQRTQRVAAAKLQARHRLMEAREARLENAMVETRELLRGYTSSPEYPRVLDQMYRRAQEELGSDLRVRGRSEDASVLKKVVGNAFDPRPEAIVGGLVAETPDGYRRLNLSFDELLRLREDRVRALLS